MKTEQEILKYWEENKIFAKSQQKEGSPFVFYEGPPTANGRPGLHHVLARAYKDVVLRYQEMCGKQVKRRAGWDTHGLPVELQVEKQLGISGKKQIENIVPGDKRASIIKFNQLCKENVWQYKKDWEDLTSKIGFWLDLDNPYITYENSYIEKLWGIIKKISDKNLLVKSNKTVSYCPRCETTLSSHELAQGYKDANDPSLFVLLGLVGKDEYLLVWTTTPWTLPANLAVTVNSKEKYGLYRVDGKKIWIAQIRAESLGIESNPENKLLGNEMVGWTYEPLYRSEVANEKCYRVYSANFVTMEEGTGLVHIAPGFGEDDYNFGKEKNLPSLVTIDQTGKLITEVPGQGKFIKEADKDILKDLQSRGLVFKSDRIVHSFPFCWRCDTPIIYVARESWFILMSKLREKLIAENGKIDWIPSHLKDGRFGNWLTEVKDWAFSRERYWGTPLPVWVCQTGNNRDTKTNNQKRGCGNITVIGSVDELKSKISSGDQKLFDNLDLHRPYIDEIKIICEKCHAVMSREPYVCDVWFDSGAMPFASGEFDAQRYPADYISEAIDQTRGWFYTLLAIGVLLDAGTPYKRVISLNHILDAKGQKMSKSKGNIVDPWEILSRYSADSLRLYLFSVNQPGDNKLFSEKDLATVHRKSILLVNNIMQFLTSYQEIDNVNLKNIEEVKAIKLLNKWLEARTRELINIVNSKMNQYDITSASRAIMDYLDDLSTWYLRRSRKDRTREFYSCISNGLRSLASVIAPFAPFIAESIYLELGGNDSVHLQKYPASSTPDSAILENMKNLREVVALAFAKRAEAKIKVRQPLNSITVVGYSISSEEEEILKDEVNVIKVVSIISDDNNKRVELDTNLTAELKKEGEIRELIHQIQDARKQAGFKYSQKVKVVIEGDPTFEITGEVKERIQKDTITVVVSGLSNIKAVKENNNLKVTVGL